MCTKDIQTIVYPDGQERTESTVTRCSKAPAGYECAQPRVFTYPQVYAESRLPPTPRLTPSNSPRPSTPRGYVSASDRESDHSRRSGGSGGSGRRRERYTTYHGTSDPSGAKVININRSGTGLGRQERILIVENPPTSRTPPQAFTMPFTAPSSPRSGYTMAADHYGRHDRSARRDTLRPVIVDERPSRHVRFNEAGGPSSPSPYLGHRRTHSNESRNSHGPSSDDERRSARRSLRQETSDFTLFPEQDDAYRRRERRRERAAAAAAAAPPSSAEEQKLDRDLKKAERIAQMNSHIDARSAVPVPGLNRTTTDVAGEQRDRELRDAVRQMNISPAAPLRRRETGMSREDEAQKRRLEERMMPRRRATVGPGSRRNRVVYENGVYVWE